MYAQDKLARVPLSDVRLSVRIYSENHLKEVPVANELGLVRDDAVPSGPC